MPKYKILMHYPDGTEDEEDGVFDSEEEAEECAGELIGCFREGAETLHLSNPGDYPLTDEEPDYEIIEIDD